MNKNNDIIIDLNNLENYNFPIGWIPKKGQQI